MWISYLYDGIKPEEWTNLDDKPKYKKIKKKLAGYIPENPAPFVDTSYKTMPHHILLLKSQENYYARKKLKEEQEKK